MWAVVQVFMSLIKRLCSCSRDTAKCSVLRKLKRWLNIKKCMCVRQQHDR